MNVRDMLLTSHRLKHTAQDILFDDDDMVIAIQDHYTTPRLSVFRRNEDGHSALFQINADSIDLVDGSQFDGDIKAAEDLVNRLLEREV